MDGASFDRLSLLVHRLGDRVTRRQALRTVAVSPRIPVSRYRCRRTSRCAALHGGDCDPSRPADGGVMRT